MFCTATVRALFDISGPAHTVSSHVVCYGFMLTDCVASSIGGASTSPEVAYLQCLLSGVMHACLRGRAVLPPLTVAASLLQGLWLRPSKPAISPSPDAAGLW